MNRPIGYRARRRAGDGRGHRRLPDLGQENGRELYRLGLESVPFLLAVGDLVIGWLLLQQAEIALAALDGDQTDRDRAFYDGKVAAAAFFAKNMLPRLTADRRIVEDVDLTIMDLREQAF